MVCQLLWLFATENDGNVILDLQIIEIFPREHDPGPYFSSPAGDLSPCVGEFLAPPLGLINPFAKISRFTVLGLKLITTTGLKTNMAPASLILFTVKISVKTIVEV